MTFIRVSNLFLLSSLTAVWLMAGCSQKSDPPAAVTIEEVPATIKDAFQNAKPEVRSAVNEIATAVSTQEDTKAFIELQNLCGNPELTSEQRMAATRSMLAVNERLHAAAARGDKKASDLLELHRARK